MDISRGRIKRGRVKRVQKSQDKVLRYRYVMGALKYDPDPVRHVVAALQSHSPRHYQTHNWVVVVPRASDSRFDSAGMLLHLVHDASI